MVLTFKLRAADHTEHRVRLDVFEQLTRNTRPWYVSGSGVGAPRRFGVCPWCDNPVQLVGMLQTDGERKQAAHGRHLNHRQAGFAVFDPHSLRSCPYQRKGRPFRIDERAPASITRLKIRRLAIEQFDRLMLILKQDTGINYSSRLAAALLETWLAAEHWRYAGASLRNIAWMLAYMAPNTPLKGQYLRDGSDLRAALKDHVSTKGQVTVRSGLGVHFQNHKVSGRDGEDAAETLEMVVSDFSAASHSPDAPVVFSKQLKLEHSRFLRLLDTRSDHPARNQELLAIADQLAARFPPPPLEEDQ